MILSLLMKMCLTLHPSFLSEYSSVQRVTWLCLIFWHHYEIRENNHAHITARSVHSYKLSVTTKHFWERKHLQGKKRALWIKLDIKIKFLAYMQVVSAKSRSTRSWCSILHCGWVNGGSVDLQVNLRWKFYDVIVGASNEKHCLRWSVNLTCFDLTRTKEGWGWVN